MFYLFNRTPSFNKYFSRYILPSNIYTNIFTISAKIDTIIDLLNSTGIRVGELVNLDIKDMNFDERECIVLGKGDKERIVYFDAKTKLHLKKYLKTSDDTNPALFVIIRRPHRRLKACGVQIMLKTLGDECNVKLSHKKYMS